MILTGPVWAVWVYRWCRCPKYHKAPPMLAVRLPPMLVQCWSWVPGGTHMDLVDSEWKCCCWCRWQGRQNRAREWMVQGWKQWTLTFIVGRTAQHEGPEVYTGETSSADLRSFIGGPAPSPGEVDEHLLTLRCLRCLPSVRGSLDWAAHTQRSSSPFYFVCMTTAEAFDTSLQLHALQNSPRACQLYCQYLMYGKGRKKSQSKLCFIRENA